MKLSRQQEGPGGKKLWQGTEGEWRESPSRGSGEKGGVLEGSDLERV
jgi:hypothetical protein